MFHSFFLSKRLPYIHKGRNRGLLLYLNSIVNNIYTAEELTEDTFFRLMIKKPGFAGRSSFKSWLYSIGRNVAVDHLRHNSKLLPTEDMAAYLADESDLERSYIKEERRILVHKALGKLNPISYPYSKIYLTAKHPYLMNGQRHKIRASLYEYIFCSFLYCSETDVFIVHGPVSRSYARSSAE